MNREEEPKTGLHDELNKRRGVVDKPGLIEQRKKDAADRKKKMAEKDKVGTPITPEDEEQWAEIQQLLKDNVDLDVSGEKTILHFYLSEGNGVDIQLVVDPDGPRAYKSSMKSNW
jgi:hypothetical protein